MRHKGLIGVHVGTRCICAAQMSGLRRQVRTLLRLPRPATEAEPGSREIESLARTLSRRGFSGDRVAVALPESAVVSAMLELPPRQSGAPIEQLARAEVARMHRLGSGGFEIASWDLPGIGGAERATQVMALACPHERAEQLIATFEEGGLSVEVLEPRACAIARACDTLLAPDGLSAIVEVGWAVTRALFILQGVLVYERTLPDAGCARLHESVGRAVGLDDEASVERTIAQLGASGEDERRGAGVRALVRDAVQDWLEILDRDVVVARDYVLQRHRREQVDRLVIAGPGADVPLAAAKLGESLGAGAQAASLGSIVQRCPPEWAQASDMCVAVGLAMGGGR